MMPIPAIISLIAVSVAAACVIVISLLLVRKYRKKISETEQRIVIDDKLILDSSVSFVSVIDLDGNVLYNNPPLTRFRGLKAGEKGRLKDRHSSDFYDTFRSEIIKTTLNGNSWKGYGDLVGADGKSIPIAMIASPILKNNCVIAVSLHMRDAGMEMNAEKMMAEHVRAFKFLTDFSLQFFTPYDYGSLVLKALAQLEKLLFTDRINIFEYSCGKYKSIYEQKAEKFSSLLGVEFFEDASKLFYRQLKTETYVYYEDLGELYASTENINFGGKTGFFVPMTNNGEFIGVMSYETIAEPIQWSENERQLAIMATSVIAGAFALNEKEKKLIETTKIASEANTAKSLYLSTMSHEIRTPMNAVLGMIDIASSSNDVERIKSCLATAKASAMHMLSVINDVLDLSKIESGNMEISAEPFSLDKTLKSLFSILSYRAGEKNQKLVLNVAKDVPDALIGDSVRFSQVLMNLLSNAIKFSDGHKSITTDIGVYSFGTDEIILSVSVTDEGIGMSPEQLSKLFRPFTQADNSESARLGGTGLGLSISKSIVEMSGGSIKAESELKKGSRFTFTMPFKKCKEQRSALSDLKSTEPKHRSQEKNDVFAGKKLLLVEDIGVNREIVRMMLEDTHIAITEAENGQVAVDLICKDPEFFDCILMDMQMPILDGIDATVQIREKFPDLKLPIIAMTANAFKEDEQACIKAGMNAYLSKPLDYGLMLEVLSEQMR